MENDMNKTIDNLNKAIERVLKLTAKSEVYSKNLAHDLDSMLSAKSRLEALAKTPATPKAAKPKVAKPVATSNPSESEG